MATITLDVVVETVDPPTAEAAIKEIRNTLILNEGWDPKAVDTLTFEPVTDRGPGGGWPVVRVSGEDSLVYDLVLWYVDGDKDDADDLFFG